MVNIYVCARVHLVCMCACVSCINHNHSGPAVVPNSPLQAPYIYLGSLCLEQCRSSSCGYLDERQSKLALLSTKVDTHWADIQGSCQALMEGLYLSLGLDV